MKHTCPECLQEVSEVQGTLAYHRRPGQSTRCRGAYGPIPAKKAAPVAEPKHTPGPWIVERVSGGDHDIGIRATGGHVSGYVAFINTEWAHESQRLEQEANARLIADSPDLYANLYAAQSLCLQLEHDGKETARQRDELSRSHDQLFKVVQRFEAHLRNRIADGPPMTDDECLSALSDVMGSISRGAKFEGSL